MTVLVFDLETIPHPDVPAYPQREGDDGAPAAPHHRIVSACALVLRRTTAHEAYDFYDADQLVQFGRDIDQHGEFGIIVHVARAFARQPQLVTWNGPGFDLRVIETAALEHGIQVPYLYSRDVTYRYSAAGQLDLMDHLSQFGAARRARQDAYARRCGLPGKMGVTGGDVAALYAAGHLDKIERYNAQDVAQLTGVFIRREYVSGALTLDGYRASARSLVSLCESHDTLRPIVEQERFDRKRFLLEE